jgi:hypothetical protein
MFKRKYADDVHCASEGHVTKLASWRNATLCKNSLHHGPWGCRHQGAAL